MALNDTFTIQEMDMDKEDISCKINETKLETYWSNECGKHPANNHCKVYCD